MKRLLTVLLVACGDDDSSGSGSKPETASPASEVSGTPIRIGTICTCSGPHGTGLAGVKTLAEAWVRYVNKNGGLSGHPVELVFKDDRGDATAATARARELIDEGVTAIVGNFSLQQDAWASSVTEAGIPVVGAANLSPIEASNANWFPVGANPSSTSFQQLKGMAEAGKTRLAVLYCTEARRYCTEARQWTADPKPSCMTDEEVASVQKLSAK